MNPEHSTAARSLRAVSLVITMVSLVVFSTLAYSSYADYGGAIGVLSQESAGSGVKSTTVVQGGVATVYVNITVPNKGLYALRVELSCIPDESAGVSCNDASVTVPPGQEGTLRFVMTLNDGGQSGSVPPGVRGNLSMSLVPFATLRIVVDLAALAGKG